MKTMTLAQERRENEKLTGYLAGDYVNIRVDTDFFRGRIVKFLYSGKSTTPSQALVEVCSTIKKVSGVSKTEMAIPLSSLSPLL
jgi:hypothetical protein